MGEVRADAASPLRFAVIGSGPSGCYMAQFLRKRWHDSEIVMFDRSALPFGLLRYGVAPDHHGTKAIMRQFERLFERDGVRFVGGTEIGTDLTLDSLRDEYDAVVLATGLSADRLVDVPGADLPGVYGAGWFARLINGHPDEPPDRLVLGARVTIVGQGNVAIDLVRLLLATPDELRSYSVAENLIEILSTAGIRTIDVVGRSLVSAAKFDVAMIRELGKIPGVRFESDDSSDPVETDGSASKSAVLRELVAGSFPTAPRVVRFLFGWLPEFLTGTDRVDSATFAAANGSADRLELATDAVLTAIGFEEAARAPLTIASHATDALDLERGVVADGLFCVGWLRRGPRGTIPDSRTDARMVVDVIAEYEERKAHG
jgi:ferredoxin--NADP+ reductase